ncbi:MAG: GIY-YIG nuclease family protein [Patescibacteria group bacterium]|nr:GIY-YIG nuclease family protein [Patescibacteria group bacterium]
MYYVYFLKLNNGNIYKGSTGDIQRRIGEHNNGKVASTCNHRPTVLIGFEAYTLKTDVQRREKFLKTTEGRRLLKQQYRDIINQT